MRCLFIIGGEQKTRTVFNLAEKMAETGSKIILLFVGNGRHASALQCVGRLKFAESVNVLKADSEEQYYIFPDGIVLLDYDGCMDLIEACDKMVSWT